MAAEWKFAYFSFYQKIWKFPEICNEHIKLRQLENVFRINNEGNQRTIMKHIWKRNHHTPTVIIIIDMANCIFYNNNWIIILAESQFIQTLFLKYTQYTLHTWRTLQNIICLHDSKSSKRSYFSVYVELHRRKWKEIVQICDEQ